MNTFIRFSFAVPTLLLICGQSIGQIQRGNSSVTDLQQSNQHFDSAFIQKIILQHPARTQWNHRTDPSNNPASGLTASPDILQQKKSPLLSTSRTLGTPGCQDTSGRLVTTENGEYFAPGGAITKLRDGNVLAPGFHQQKSTPFYSFPDLVKYDPAGNVIWSKIFDGPGIYPMNAAAAYNTFELNDGSILMAGEMEVPTAWNSREELILWRLDANGNVLWVQTDSCSIWVPNNGHLDVMGMTQDPAGNIYLCGNQYIGDAITTGSFVLKMDLAGNIAWDRYYSYRSSQCYGILYLGGELSVYGVNPFLYMPDASGNQTNSLWNIRINPSTGDTLRTKSWYADFGANSGWNSLLNRGWVQQLSNGNIAITGDALAEHRINVTPVIHGITTEFDPSFRFIRGWMLESNLPSSNYSTVINEHASGRISYIYIPTIPGYSNPNVMGAAEQGQIVKERVLDGKTLQNNWSTNFLNFSASQDMEMQWVSDGVTNTINGEEFIRLHDSDTSSVCTGTDTAISWMVPYGMLPFPYFRCDSISKNSFRRSNRPVPAPADGILQQQSACKLVSFCDSMKIFSNQLLVCAGQPVTFICRRNPACGARPVWLYDTTDIQSATTPTDTTLQLIYRNEFHGNLKAAMTGTCKNVRDSLLFTVLPAGASISLGPDGWLCPDSTTVLRPTKGYPGYVWQDGSVADTLRVTAPGKYYVTVTNTCGSPMTDTVVFQTAPALNFYIGPDTAYCLKDPVTLLAPDGYNQYLWRSGNQTINNNTKSFIVYPPATTQYIAAAQTAQGCMVKDSILITIKIPDPVHLGNDTSFCTGDSILLNAGSGFLNYSWNTGASAATVWASKQGTYSVKAQSANGCYGSDTLIIKKLFPLPQVQLDPDNWLCEGSTRTLNAGRGYQSYLWQDGSGSSTLNVDTLGKYTVRVKDYNGCVGGDTVLIDQIIPKSSGFLMTDTLICDGFPTKIQASASFSSYDWSTGDQKNYITIKKAGIYSLTITDQYGCTATSSVSVTTKQCLYGIFFPNAFSPNYDGHNDLFRPNVFGELTKYQLQIFNRWGQKMFESADYTQGWEGTLGEMMQVSGVYVWLCHYQFEGEPEKTQSGTVVLIR